MDYRRFLARRETLVLPYTGGAYVHAPGRRLLLTSRVAAGYWSFQIEGRRATALQVALPLSMQDRPRLRGHTLGDWLFTGGPVERLYLIPHEEPAPLSPVTARRWHNQQALFESVEFEDEPELRAREALEEGLALGQVRGLMPSARAAFGFGRARKLARQLGIHVSPGDFARGTAVLASCAEELLQAEVESLVPRPAAHAQEERPAVEPASSAPVTRVEVVPPMDPEQRAREALAAAGASLLAVRMLGADQMEVRFRFLRRRFLSIVERESLHVYDAGICLDGHDEQLTLESLPAVIREAVENDELVITRRA